MHYNGLLTAFPAFEPLVGQVSTHKSPKSTPKKTHKTSVHPAGRPPTKVYAGKPPTAMKLPARGQSKHVMFKEEDTKGPVTHSQSRPFKPRKSTAAKGKGKAKADDRDGRLDDEQEGRAVDASRDERDCIVGEAAEEDSSEEVDELDEDGEDEANDVADPVLLMPKRSNRPRTPITSGELSFHCCANSAYNKPPL